MLERKGIDVCIAIDLQGIIFPMIGVIDLGDCICGEHAKGTR
jgi:hypothetical protein